MNYAILTLKKELDTLSMYDKQNDYMLDSFKEQKVTPCVILKENTTECKQKIKEILMALKTLQMIRPISSNF